MSVQKSKKNREAVKVIIPRTISHLAISAIKNNETAGTYLTEHNQRCFLIEMLHTRRPIRFRRRVSVRVDRQVKRPGRIGSVVREPLALVHSVVQQPVDLGHAGFHERRDIGGRDAAQTLQCGREPEQVVRRGEEEEEEQDEAEKQEQDTSSAAAERPHACAPVHPGGHGERGFCRGERSDAGAVFGRWRSAAGAGARAGLGIATGQHRELLHEKGGR